MVAILSEDAATQLGIRNDGGPGYVERALLEAILMIVLVMITEESHLKTSSQEEPI